MLAPSTESVQDVESGLIILISGDQLRDNDLFMLFILNTDDGFDEFKLSQCFSDLRF